jgi:hypothetical protein
MIRSPLALKRLSWNQQTAQVGYTARPTRRSGPRPATVSWDVLEFIARVVDHIPEPSQQMTRYWGWYANAARGQRRKKADEGEQASPGPAREDADDDFTRQARLSWAKLIRRVYEIDPLLCPFCGTEIGTRRRRRRGAEAAPSAARLWANTRLHHRLCHRPGDPPQSEASGSTTRASGPRTTARARASRSDSLSLPPPRSSARPRLDCARKTLNPQGSTPQSSPPAPTRG